MLRNSLPPQSPPAQPPEDRLRPAPPHPPPRRPVLGRSRTLVGARGAGGGESRWVHEDLDEVESDWVEHETSDNGGRGEDCGGDVQEPACASVAASCHTTCSAVDPLGNSNYFEPERCAWSEVAKEADELIGLKKSRFTYFASNSDVGRVRKDSKCRGKRKASFLLQSRGRDLFTSSANKEENEVLEDIEMPVENDFCQNNTEYTLDEISGGSQHSDGIDEDTHMPVEMAAHYSCTEHSVSSLLGNMEKNSSGQYGISGKLLLNRGTNRKIGFTGKRNLHLGNRFVEYVEYHELLENAISSDEDDNKCQLSLATRENKEKIRVDLFDVFDAGAVISIPAPLNSIRSDFHSRLQNILQKEKDSQTKFLKQLQMKSIQNDDLMCLYVQILSRSLDARLIVCECLTYENKKEMELNLEKHMGGTSNKRTIIFRSKICKDVDLEVGSLVCIHSPWQV